VKLSLRFYGDPVLRQKSTPVAAVDDRLRKLADDMVETMHGEDGIGLAAQQVGETISLCVVDVPAKGDTDEAGTRLNPDVAMPMTLFNPEIVETSDETDVYEEGCLSFPEIRAPVTRPSEVVVRWTDRDGTKREQRLRGLVARCVQHEMDHLAGVLICDRMSAVKKVTLSGKLKRLKRETEEALGLA
jgi:peptide deformylase